MLIIYGAPTGYFRNRLDRLLAGRSHPAKVSGAPLLKGTRMPADVVVVNYADRLPAESIAEFFELPADTVRSLLTYAVEHNPSLKP